mmetsp:Transcript_38212/g.50334  ORF Transcript_38212/g.50334 Transcript_38212/m.50334 type:complete len:505 (-) Transcript_38212:297-1811(-)
MEKDFKFSCLNTIIPLLVLVIASFLPSASGDLFSWPSAEEFIKELRNYGVKPESSDQLHLAYGYISSSEVWVSWVTEDDADSVVYFGDHPSNLNEIAYGETVRYSYRSFYYGSYESGYLHHVLLTGLQPNTRYFYRVGNHGFTLTDVFDTFITPPPVGDSSQISFAVIGDLGQTEDSQCTVEHVDSDDSLLFVVHAGDLAYADCYQPRWDSYQELISPVSRKLPWMVIPGNHEIEYDSITNTTFVAYEARYRMPQIKPAEFEGFQPVNLMDYFNCQPSEYPGSYDFGNSFYSFDVGTVHFVMLNSYTKTKAGSKQYKWVQSDLKKVDRQVTPWVIVIMHAPWYHSNIFHQNETEPMQMKNSMEHLFEKYDVNLVLSGHVHAYERTYPMLHGSIASSGPTYITVGDGGNREGHANYWMEEPEWSALRNGDTFGYGKITVENNSHLLWEWKMNTGEKNHEVGDSVHVVNAKFLQNELELEKTAQILKPSRDAFLDRVKGYTSIWEY